MHRPAFVRSALVAGAVLLLASNEAGACACCSDPGDHGTQTIKIEGFHTAELENLEFAAATQLHLTDADDGPPKGVNIESESFEVVAAFDAKGWRLTFRAADGKTGEITLRLPPKLTIFAADIHDGKTSGGGGPLLYKEWRFEGTASATGFFAKAPARYTLILQGRGNRCDSSSDFTHWRLAIEGKQADFAFFGELASAGR